MEIILPVKTMTLPNIYTNFTAKSHFIVSLAERIIDMPGIITLIFWQYRLYALQQIIQIKSNASDQNLQYYNLYLYNILLLKYPS